MRVGTRGGFALLTSLAFLTILSVLAYAFQSGMELTSTVATGALQDEQARALAAGGVAEAQAALTGGADLAPLGAPHPVGEGTVAVRVEDVGGKLHLNQAPVEEIAALLGVEAAAVARARPFYTVHDAYAALRLGPDQYATVRAHTTVRGDGRLNLDAAPEEVLRVVAGLSPSQAEAIVRRRVGPDGRAGTPDDVSVNSAEGLAAVPGIDPATVRRLTPRLSTEPLWYRVVAEGRMSRRTARVEALLHRAGARWVPVAWVEWASAS